MKFRIYLLLLISIVVFMQCRHIEKIEDHSWPAVKTENKPGTYWWWMGSAVDKKNLTYNLEAFNDAGIGTVHVVPIYGVKGEEDNYIDFLSEKWMEMLAFTSKEAHRLNMQADMSTTTGWPFGGSHVTEEYAALKLKFDKYSIATKINFKKQIDTLNLVTIIAQSSGKPIKYLTNLINNNGVLSWTSPEGEWDIYIIQQVGTKQKVKRAAPGNEGLVLNPFSKDALKFYLKRYDTAFTKYKDIKIRAQYHDSYEYYRANWMPDFFNQFQHRNGYDLKEHLPQLIDTLKMDARITADYRRTLSDLHLNYIEQWTGWSHKNGWITRNQAHGAPGNLLDIYAAADIPETEMFGSRKLKIPGIKYNVTFNPKMGAPNPLIVKFASSAAHVSGKKLISSETATWLRNHYNASLSQVKPEIDELFYSGVNHIFYHGNAYSPKEAIWPGWNFYASTHFEQENAFWRDFSSLNSYVTRCQSILQSGKPANDILLYWPVEDIYHNFPDADGFYKSMGVHNVDWFETTDFGKLATYLDQEGYSFDYISDKQLHNINIDDHNLITYGNVYKTIIVPITKHIPLKTWKQLLHLSENGATIIFQDKLPSDVPGFNHLKKRRIELHQSQSELNFIPNKNKLSQQVKLGNGNLIIAKNIDTILYRTGILKEEIIKYEVRFIKRIHEKGLYYFLTNFSDKNLDKWVTLSVPFESAMLLDPRTQDRIGVANTRIKDGKTEIYLQLQPGESCFVKTFSEAKISGKKWHYIEINNKSIPLNGKWQVDFIDGGPKLPASFTTSALKSWTILGNIDAQNFAGTGRYKLVFNKPEVQADNWVLNLGNVSESARIKLNGIKVGALWSAPFNILIGDYLKQGENTLEIEVTNLSANRIRYNDLNGVDWKKYYFVNVFYKKFDAAQWPIMESGLIGPVTLTPVHYKK